MKAQAYLVPPSSHFLNSLVNFLLSHINFEDPETSGIYIILPTKRATLFLRHYLIQKINRKAFFLPKIQPWEDFLLETYIYLADNPKTLLPEPAKTLIFLRSVPQRNKLWEEPEKLLYWSSLFLEVFEEFEKEGRIPTNLLYPPEDLPLQARELFEDLRSTYEAYKKFQEKNGFLFLSEVLGELKACLSEKTDNFSFIKGLVMAGFVAFREAEKQFLAQLMENLDRLSTTVNFFFESQNPPPKLLQETLKGLGLPYEVLPQKFHERVSRKTRLHLISFSDGESEAYKVEEILKEAQISKPDEIAIVLPKSSTLMPLLPRLKDLSFHINITLPFPARVLPLNRWLILILKAQKERKMKAYPTSLFLQIFSFPLLRLFQRDYPLLEGLIKNIRDLSQKRRNRFITKEEIEENLEALYQDSFCLVYRILFENWENLDSPNRTFTALSSLLDFLWPFFERESETEEINFLLTRQFLAEIERKVLPLFKITSLWEELPPLEERFFYHLLESLLLSLELPLYGDPLKGLQILGFLESRLLSFKKILLLDVNEGALPPSTNLNPLLTDEMKTYLKLPIFKNELWDYYFERLLDSTDEAYLFYLETKKGRGELLGEPSRYVLKLQWLAESAKKNITKESIKLNAYVPKEVESIKKEDKDVEALIKILQENGLSRNALETYLTCPAKFYFSYLLDISPRDEISYEEKEMGRFIHKFFESFFGKYLHQPIRFTDILREAPWKEIFKKLWLSYHFEEKMDPLSVYLTRKIALASIEKYFLYLSSLESPQSDTNRYLESTITTGLEKRLEFMANPSLPIKPSINSVKFYGIIDWVGLRVFSDDQAFCLILDFKTGLNTKTGPKTLSKLIKSTPPETLGLDSLQLVGNLFGDNLCNFQLLFYLYLLNKNQNMILPGQWNGCFGINAAYVTITDFEKPEKLICEFDVKKSDSLRHFLENTFQDYLFWIVKHLLEEPEFHMIIEEPKCSYCDYKILCKTYRKKGEVDVT
ncbi:MAG: PD-(D/E)XK nuclease family protein [Caldimicrobium sp.]|nr:PD-(D/E)XK nuclease family protein [Caldimicrobium sp.]MCX7613454.1 PD-(D/E)XK nuclease family protein [Caldimicrobium sp.]MDW8182974.1 PD-(D/E)XK nuclease family protein [Caldimicrobium sp.]